MNNFELFALIHGIYENGVIYSYKIGGNFNNYNFFEMADFLKLKYNLTGQFKKQHRSSEKKCYLYN